MASDAEEVAEDYRHALEDLSSNMRFEISNLTVIARENTEHALAIAEVLQQHILKAAPNKKLPALYVLDSIVKNVGTPYTLYFGRTLFKTFMESYVVVDNAVRKKMEEMLRTWKDPVPGSLDTRPVFSHELVRPIENALMKARAATMVSQGPLPGRPRPNMMPHRNTPTPPGMPGAAGPAGSYPPAGYPYPNGGRPGEGIPPQHAYAGHQQPPYYPPHSVPQPVAPAAAAFQPQIPGMYAAPAPAGVSVETLSYDIQNLIVAMRAEFSKNPHDDSVQNRLRALLDLQGVMQSTRLPPDQLELIKNKVTELAAVTMRPAPAQNLSIPGLVPPPHHQARPQLPQPTSVTLSPAPVAPANEAPLSLDALLGQGAMAALMSRTRSQSGTPQTSTPNPPYGSSAIRSPPPTHSQPPPVNAPAPPPAADRNPLSLLDQLRAAGLLPSSTPTNAGPAAAPPPAQHPSATSAILPPNLSSLLAAATATPARPGPDAAFVAGLNPAALKQQFRPDIIAGLYDGLGPPCTQCGRRFRTDVEGKRKKMAHMDWHFQVHTRMTEAEKRGTHRSWYADQQDWLKSREEVDADHVAAAAAEEASAQVSKAEDRPKYIPVPDPTSGINNVCPICQEKFENKWLDTAQEWVWLDAVLVGNRAYHASCHTEATRDRESTPGLARRTPEPVLGKRKAESSISSPKVRTMKTYV